MKSIRALKVVELASVLAGPSVGMFFAELGAEVHKIENKLSNGDVTRSWKLATEDENHPFSAYYSAVNYGKTSYFLNAANENDYQQILELIKSADIVIANFKPGDAEKLKLDFESLKKINDELIYGEITGFGTENRIAYDMVLQAESGMLSMNGSDENNLCKLPIAFIDLFAAHQLKEGILLALLESKSNPKAYKITVSLLDAAIASLANQATNYLMADKVAKPLGMLHPNIAPYGEMFKTKEGKRIVLAVGSDKQFRNLCAVLQIEEVAKDLRFSSNQNRLAHRVELQDLLNKAFRKFNHESLMSEFIKYNVPAGTVRNIAEVFDTKAAQSLIMEEQKENRTLRSVKSSIFNITT